jgi:hypothetical protein
MSVFEGCLVADNAADCANIAGCVYSEGKELIPDHEFCAPMDLTKDTTLIQTCLSADSATTCGTGCQWRQGRTSTTDNNQGSSPAGLFTTDFCHPVNVNKDTAKEVWS